MSKESQVGMPQIDEENAVEKIYGYYTPMPNESAESAFNRAKAETITNFELYLANVKHIDFERYRNNKCSGQVIKQVMA